MSLNLKLTALPMAYKGRVVRLADGVEGSDLDLCIF